MLLGLIFRVCDEMILAFYLKFVILTLGFFDNLRMKV